MTASEMAAVWAMMVAYDGREPADESVIRMWLAVLDDLPTRDVVAAIQQYYRERTYRIMPADIRERVGVIRRERLAIGPPFIPPDDMDPDDQAAYLEAKRRHFIAVRDGVTTDVAIR